MSDGPVRDSDGPTADRPGGDRQTGGDDLRNGSDADLLQAVQRMFDVVDPPPAHVVDHARGAFAWHGVDSELAELIYDSDAAPASSGVRGGAGARQMTFRAPGLEIEVEVVSERTRIIIGQLVPAQGATIELRQHDHTARAEADSLGRFTFDGVTPGAIKLSVVTESGATVQTEGLTI